MKKKNHSLKDWFETYERRISVASLVGGFIFDSLTLQGIDNLWDNLWITFNILLSGFCIIMLNRQKGADEGFWLPNILQFSFGALLGSTFVFYLRSATLSATWPFLALMFFAILANEFFQKKYARLALQLSFLYFAIFSFVIFLIPLLTKSLSVGVFMLSGLASLAALYFFLIILRYFARERFLEERTHIWAFVSVIFLSVNILYFTNLIPPIPLSLKEAGIYHGLEKSTAGNYIVYEENRGWEKYLTAREPIHWKAGETLFAYTAVFAPGSLNTDAVHEWQYKNNDGDWVTATRIPLYLSGGRAGGFRTYSQKENFTPGDWRVDVKTPRGQIIGRISFKIIPVDTTPALSPVIKN